MVIIFFKVYKMRVEVYKLESYSLVRKVLCWQQGKAKRHNMINKLCSQAGTRLCDTRTLDRKNVLHCMLPALD